MKKLIFLIIFLITKTTYAAPVNDFVVAKINNKIITNSELLDRYRFILFIAKINVKSKEEEKLLYIQALDKMIDEELIRQDASKLKIEVDPQEVREAVDAIALQQKKNATQFKLSLLERRLSFDNYLKQIESEILWSKIISSNLRPRVKITDIEVEEFFEQQNFDPNVRKFHLGEVYIPKSENALSLANKLAVELKNGADFPNVARQFSQSVSAESGGDIGWISQADLESKIYMELLKLNKNGYTNPIAVADGYYIFKLFDSKTEARVEEKDLNAAKNIVFSRKLQTTAKGYLLDLRKKSFVEKNIAN
jgi:peptidyl-prolyl cis-trans isomerase SurA